MTDENQNFEARLLTPNDYKAFATVYNDFVNRAVTEYNFELEPLDFEGFIDAVEKKLIECVVLFENAIPVAFLVYTTAISEAIELNIIHSFKMEILNPNFSISWIRRNRQKKPIGWKL